MSADSWAACPKCGHPEQEGEETGTVREDYEIGILNGEFFIHYRGECREPGCDFLKTFEYREDVDTSKQATP